ncbi:MAG: DUF2726 domain-containing protein [Firmicutes bacterium]|nr:DUF2726 domain-containing protein [Bacillota bacterium]
MGKSLMGLESPEIMLIVAVCVIIAVGAIVLIVIKLRSKEDVGFIPKFEKKHFEAASVTLNERYLHPKAMQFYDRLCGAISKDFVVFPQVGVDQLMKSTKSRVVINSVLSEYVDYVIFDRKRMRPILVIDLQDPTGDNTTFGEMHDNVREALKAIKLPVVVYYVEGEYTSEDLRLAIADYLDPLMIIAMRKQTKM